ncbi:hypothetical protein ACFSJM_00430 [Lactococcus formosensis subsp. bovis]|uniref:hypothetical protein n=1 Tax=Lactococcus formosensis TaxID=1281486 RepID=UPI001BCB5052|nr:hypothetical protein [Lactococcus formosensis]
MENVNLINKNLKKTIGLPWENLENIDAPLVPKFLSKVKIVPKDSEGKYSDVDDINLYLNNGLESVGVKYERTKAPRIIALILDYLHGGVILKNRQIYFTRYLQYHTLSEYKMTQRYKMSKARDFSPQEVLEIIQFIDSQLHIEPVKTLKEFTLAGTDFQIDLENKTVIREAPQETASYFKVFEYSYEDVKTLVPLYQEFLQSVIYDDDSLHNARLQPLYTMMVAMHLESKSKFFVSKSGVRTGKGLRHKILSSIFETKNVSLDTLSSMTSDLGWASFDGGEMLLVTEAGAITQNMERHLKVLATESTHTARAIGKDYADINLTGVLTIDSNEYILLSEDMQSRMVNIAFKDRPKEETDVQREMLFQEYWKNFTKPSTVSSGRDALPISGLAALLDSFEYWKENDYQFDFKHVEMNNLQNSTQFDSVQLLVLGEIYKTEEDYVVKTDNDILQNLLRETYSGKGSTQKRKDALDLIGMKERSIFKGKTLRVIKKTNNERFNKAMVLYKQWLTEQ